VKYDFVPLHTVYEELEENFKDHYDSMDVKEGYGEADIDWELYLALSAEGRCMVVIGIEEQKIIAYSIFIITRNPNHKKCVVAMNTGVFIKQENRGRLFNSLLKESNKYLEDIGVMEITYSISSSRLGSLLERKGFNQIQTTWSYRNASFFNTFIDSGR